MVPRPALFLSVLLASSLVQAVDSSHPKVQAPVAVVAPMDTESTADQPAALADRLGRSLANHLAHLAAMTGRGVTVTLRETPAEDRGLLDSLAGEGVREVLVVRWRGRAGERTGEIRDAHRRRYKAVVEDCLQIEAAYERRQLTAHGWEVAAGGTAAAAGRPDPNARRRPGRTLAGEPYERVVQRLVAQIGDELPPAEPLARALRATAPVKVYLGKELAADSGAAMALIRRIVDLASTHLAAQFGVALRIVSAAPLPENAADEGSLAAGYPEFRRAVSVSADTLAVAFHRMLSREQYFGGGVREEIGMAQLGRRRVYMDLLPAAAPGDTLWQAMANALTLLHEIGHALGGIHVSDVNSVMAHGANWVNAAAFDRVNEKIIGAALTGRLRFDDPAEYLATVARVLDSTAYGVADYPGFFHQFLSGIDHPADRKRLREAVGRTSFLQAADAVGLLAAGRRAAAARLLRTALHEDPDQAALYYYLSLAETGPAADGARKMAERMGYLMAGERSRTGAPDAAVDIARTRP